MEEKEAIKPEDIKKIVKRVKIPRKKEIRSLVKRKRETIIKEKKVRKFDCKKIIVSITSLLALAVSLVLYQLKYGSCEFWATYERNFNKILYGDENYCFKKIDTAVINQTLSEQIVGQLDALELIRGSLNIANNDEYIQMIFNGSTGTGKTLSSQIIENNFPNSGNIQKYIWNVHSISNLFEKVQERLSKCGYNLIILDDLENTENAIDFLKNFERKIREEVRRNRHKIVLIAIFKEELTQEEDLKDFVIVDFQKFTLETFTECIKLHQKLFNAKISLLEWEELIKIDYLSSGCKLISKKLSTI